jgi:hypothetical protein
MAGGPAFDLAVIINTVGAPVPSAALRAGFAEFAKGSDAPAADVS